MLKLVGRLLMVALAGLLAFATAVSVLLSLGLERLTHAAHGREFNEDTAGAAFDLLIFALRMASAATILPALAVILIGEVARIRSATFYILAGGLALAAIPLLSRLGLASSSPGGQFTAAWQIFATAGFAGGFVYWLLAGRRA